jgi:hypothetical protein
MADINFWKPIYQAFKHEKPLISYQDLNDFYVRREDSPVERLVNFLAMEDRAAKFLLSGHRGSGKTTELRRLEQQCLADYTVVWVDTDTALDKFNIGYAEIPVLIGISIVQKLEEIGWQLPQILRRELLASLASITYQEKNSGEGKLELPQLFKDIGVLLKVGFQRETSRIIEVSPTLSEIVDRVNAIIQAAEADKSKLLVIVDGLDLKDFKIAADMFSKSLLTDLTCHIVYTIPISLYYSSALRSPMEIFDQCLDLANIAIFKCDEQKRPTQEADPVGRHILMEVIRKRLARLGMSPQDLFESGALDFLCEQSGGVMREVVRLVRATCGMASLKKVKRIDQAIVQEAVQEVRKTYTIEDYYFSVLAQIHQTGELTSEKFDSPRLGKEVAICDELLLYKLILGYEDPRLGRWYDINPILLADLQRWQQLQS